MCVECSGVECNGWQMDVVWVYGDGGILILPLLLENAPTFIGTFWEVLGCSIFLSLFVIFFIFESSQISFLYNEMPGSNKKQWSFIKWQQIN
jgi:hypothetical protein